MDTYKNLATVYLMHKRASDDYKITNVTEKVIDLDSDDVGMLKQLRQIKDKSGARYKELKNRFEKSIREKFDKVEAKPVSVQKTAAHMTYGQGAEVGAAIGAGIGGIGGATVGLANAGVPGLVGGGIGGAVNGGLGGALVGLVSVAAARGLRYLRNK